MNFVAVARQHHSHCIPQGAIADSFALMRSDTTAHASMTLALPGPVLRRGQGDAPETRPVADRVIGQ
jgi:hypothetical protein